MGITNRIRRFVSNGSEQTARNEASAFIAEQSGKLSTLSIQDIDRITADALARANGESIREDAQAHRELLKTQSGQIVRRQPK